MLLEHERNYGLGMDALVSGCSWKTNGIMVWDGLGMDALVSVCSGNANGIMVSGWMLWSSYALGTRTELWFGHGCSGHRMLWEHERDYGLGWFGHGCSGQRMLWEHERDYGLGMDALVSVCSGNTNGVMGECPWSPGTWRRWSQTPSIPLSNGESNGKENGK